MATTRTALLAALLCSLLAPGRAGEPPAKKEEGKKQESPKKKADEEPERAPVHIWADHVRYLRDDNVANITGSATVIKGDMRIDADNIRATLVPRTNRFKKITATGGVRMYKVLPISERTAERPPLQLAPDNHSATCEIAVYDLGTGVIVLYGSPGKQPTVHVGNDLVQADVITHDRVKNRMTFEGKVQVTALIPKKTEGPAPPTK